MEQKQKTADAGEIKVDTKSKILFVVLGILIAGSIAVTYWRYMVKRDYVIQAQIDCDPETESCLVWQCDPTSLEEDEQCTGVPDNDIWYYKILNRNAKNIPNCDPKDESCTVYQCDPEESECNITSCSPSDVKEGEECSTPEQYLLENPPEEEYQCEEGDEECALEQECEADDEECLNAQSAECDPESEDCSILSSEECAPGDEECQNAAAQENPAECDSTSQDCGSAEPNQTQSVTPGNDAQKQNTGPDNLGGANILP